jgi:hypothetical protein
LHAVRKLLLGERMVTLAQHRQHERIGLGDGLLGSLDEAGLELVPTGRIPVFGL